MSGIKQPVTQVRLTNVSVVRYKNQGIRFEVACYKNKIVSFRAGLEADIDEVLQSPHIFSNVSKGVLAKDEDLMKVFHSIDRAVIAQQILSKGEIQVSDKERAAQLAASFKDIAVAVADMCINPSTGRPYPVRMIERGMKECHFSINPTKSTKSQALALIKSLKTVMPIERAAMRIAITINLTNNTTESVKTFKDMIRELAIKVEDEHETQAQVRLTTLIAPNDFKQCEQSVSQLQGSKCEIIDLKVQNAPVQTDDGQVEEKSDDDDSESEDESEVDSEAEMEQLTSQIRRVKISRPTVQKAVAQPTAPKSKKARRRDDDEEEIRTVGDRPEYDIQDEIEDSTQVLQHQQQNRSKAKKERKNKHGSKNDDDDDETAKQSTKTSAKAKQTLPQASSDSDSEWETKIKPAKLKKSRKPKANAQKPSTESSEHHDQQNNQNSKASQSDSDSKPAPKKGKSKSKRKGKAAAADDSDSS